MQESILLKKITVQATETGITETTAKVDKLAASETDLTKAEKDRAAVEAAVARQRLEYNRIAEQQLGIMKDFTASAKLMTAANDNVATSNSHLSDVLLFGTKVAFDHAASWLATVSAVAVGVRIFGSLLAILGPVILIYKGLKAAVDLVTEAWDLGGKKLAEYRDIAAKAAATDLSTDMFQRITKAATAAKLPVDDLTAAFKKLTEASMEKLGGSALQTRLDQLTKAGNFEGNTGVAQLAAANTQEQKFRAIVSVIDQAMQKGERLAALDLAGTVLGPVIAENLRKDSEYLNKMQASADKLAATEIVSAADVGRAVDLQRRYDAAVAILEQRWHPIQNLLTELGIKMQTAWVGIVESIASAVDWAVKLVAKIGELPASFWDSIKKGAVASASLAVGAIPVVGPALSIGARVAGNAMAEPPVAATTAYGEAINKLRAGLQNTHAVQQQVNEANAIANKVYGDTSKTLDDKATPAVVAQRSALVSAIAGVEKFILATDAAAKSVGTGVVEQTKAKVIADLTAAAMRDGKKNLEQYAAAWEELGERAGKAKLNLELKNLDSSIKFTSDTMFFSDTEKQIASILKAVHGDEWKNMMDGPQASAMRFNATMEQTVDLFKSVGKDMFTAFLSGKNVMDAMVQSLDNVANKLASQAFEDLWMGIATLNPAQIAKGGLEAGASKRVGSFTGDEKKRQANDNDAPQTDRERKAA